MHMTVWRSFGHRGDSLEELVLSTNKYLREKKFGIIDKISTPVKVISIDENKMITKAFFEKKSTVDFMGVIQGVAVAFDVKETNLKNFPLKNIHEHQMEYMGDFTAQGGLAFIITHFKTFDEYYLIPYEVLETYFYAKNGRKSIPYDSMNKNFQISIANNSILNYLPTLNNYLKYKKESQ